ncbi:hypothetical protein APA33_31245 [Pseudomonas aeruginosa]|nr:hypothetical protein APA33_31245 [Pseudomonas aeruginosa]
MLRERVRLRAVHRHIDSGQEPTLIGLAVQRACAIGDFVQGLAIAVLQALSVGFFRRRLRFPAGHSLLAQHPRAACLPAAPAEARQRTAQRRISPMHGHTQLAPHYFFRQQRLLRALLIDDQAWFVLDDFARLIEHSQPEQMLARLDDDQARRESLRSERGEDQAQWLISESGAYAALIYQQRGDGGELRRWLSGEVVPELRSATDDSGMPRYVKLRWERQVVHMLDWQGKLWVNFSEMPDLLERQGEPMVQLGWRRWLRKLRLL